MMSAALSATMMVGAFKFPLTYDINGKDQLLYLLLWVQIQITKDYNIPREAIHKRGKIQCILVNLFDAFKHTNCNTVVQGVNLPPMALWMRQRPSGSRRRPRDTPRRRPWSGRRRSPSCRCTKGGTPCQTWLCVGSHFHNHFGMLITTSNSLKSE